MPPFLPLGLRLYFQIANRVRILTHKFNLQHLLCKQKQIYMNDKGTRTSNIEGKEHWVLVPSSERNMENLTHLTVLISMIERSIHIIALIWFWNLNHEKHSKMSHRFFNNITSLLLKVKITKTNDGLVANQILISYTTWCLETDNNPYYIWIGLWSLCLTRDWLLEYKL